MATKLDINDLIRGKWKPGIACYNAKCKCKKGIITETSIESIFNVLIYFFIINRGSCWLFAFELFSLSQNYAYKSYEYYLCKTNCLSPYKYRNTRQRLGSKIKLNWSLRITQTFRIIRNCDLIFVEQLNLYTIRNESKVEIYWVWRKSPGVNW